MAQFKVSQGDASYNVTVPDGFLDLPQDQQHAQLAQAFQSHLGGASSAAPQAPEAPPDTSLTGALGYGADNAAHSLGNTAEVLGMGGKALQGTKFAPKNYQPVSLTGDIAAGKYSSLPGDIVRKGAEMLPAVGGLAAGAAGAVAAVPEAVAGGVGLGAAALGSAAMHFGDNVRASAANNGNAQPATGDYVRGALTTAPQAALDAVGLRVPGISKLATGALSRAAVRTAADGATAATSDQVGQIGTSLGTTAGLQDSPQQSLEAGLGALPARATSLAPGLAKGGIKAGSDAAMSRLVDQPTDVDHASAIEQANQAIDNARASANGKPTPMALANSAKSEVAANLQATFTALRQAFPEQVTPADGKSFTEALSQARRHNNTTGDAPNPGVGTLLDQMAGLDLPPEATKPLVQGLRALDVLSNASFANQTVGPFRTLGSAVAQVGAIGALAAHNPVEGLMAGGAALAGVGKPVGKLGAAIGGQLDNLVGTSTPVAILQRAAAQRMLAQSGAATPGDPVAALQAVRGGAQDAQAQIAAQRLKQQQIDAAYSAHNAPQVAPTAAPDYAKALKQLPKVADPTATYMAGKAVPGMDGTSPIGAQTAAEIAGWTQMQRNRATALAQVQKAQKVGQQAVNAQPDVAGQAALDKTARSNAKLLAAADTVPSSNPGVTDAAATAAVAMAQAKAARVMKAAGLDPVGNPLDPTPVNTPISPPPPPPPQQAPQAPPAAPAPQPAQPQPQAPQGAPVAPQGSGSVPPWMRYVMNGSSRITPAHVDQAIDAHVANGGMTPLQAAQLRAHPGVEHPSILAPIQAQALQAAGVSSGPSSVGLPASQGFGPAPTDPTVSRPAAYLYSTQAYHLDAGRLADAAEAAGMPTVKDVVENIEHAKSPADKAQIRADFLANLPPDQQAAAVRFLPDRLVTHGKK